MHVNHLWKIFVTMAMSLVATAALAGTHNLKRAVNDNDTVPVFGNVNEDARPDRDAGPVDPNMLFEKMVLVLAPRADAAERPDQVIARLHDPASPDYHHWLTPEEYGRRFGISDADLHEVTSWLQRRGFTVDEIPAGRGWINFSGNVADVESTFKTMIRKYNVNGRIYHANAKDPEVPRAL